MSNTGPGKRQEKSFDKFFLMKRRIISEDSDTICMDERFIEEEEHGNPIF